MRSTGIIRRLDSLGRFVLPKELRKAYNITDDTPLEIFTEGDTILLRKYHPAGSCALCGEVDPAAVTLHGKTVCAACRGALAKL